MSKDSPLSIDFAALRILCLVHSKKSFSAAAVDLDANQSTISYTVNRLRKVFDDPLFVRQGGGIEATPRCEELVVEARLILEQFNGMVLSQEFDPSTTQATLRISSNYYERVVILPALIRAVRAIAPGIHILMIPAQDKGPDQLRDGQADVLLSPSTINLNGIYTKQLIRDRYVCLMDKSNPLASGNLTEEMFRSANHAYVTFAQIWRSPYAVEMRRKGLDVHRVLSISSPENLSELLVGTDMIAATPKRIAMKASGELTARDLPFPALFNVSMHWTSRTNRSKMHRWIRDLIVEITRKLS